MSRCLCTDPGRVYQEAGNYSAAEKAYQESLAIEIRENNKQGEADSLGQLGNLYDDIERLEDAIRMYERAVCFYTALGNLQGEGKQRSNMASSLMKLNRMPEARTQLLRAIECKSQLCHAATPWNAWGALYNLETSEGNHQAAAEARQKTLQAYAAYRNGGESPSNSFQLISAAARALKSGATGELVQQLESFKAQTVPTFVAALLRTLIAFLRGSHDPALTEDPELSYMDAVDLKLLFFNGAGL